MDGFNNQLYEVVRENELAEMLSHYNSEYVFSVVANALHQRYTNNFITIPNVVNAWEQNFKAILDRYGSSANQEVTKVRNITYQEIINIICKEFQLNFTVAEVDLFSAASKLYQLFVCDFNNMVINFFVMYIYKEKNSIYDTMNFSEIKRNKNDSSAYSRKMFKDSKMALINCYMDKVITNLCGMDFDLYQILNIAITSKELCQFFINLVSPSGDFFKDYIVTLINSEVRPVLISNIRFQFYNIALAHDQVVLPTDIIENKGEN